MARSTLSVTLILNVTLNIIQVKKVTKGLSLQQRQILAILETKQPKNDREGEAYFSTLEIVCELHPEYHIWLSGVDQDARPRRDHYTYQQYDKYRVSVYRALKNLETREHIVSFFSNHSRFWAYPSRVHEETFDWIRADREHGRDRNTAWRVGAFIRTLPSNLKIKYNLKIANEKEIKQIKKLWGEYKAQREKQA